MISESIFSLKAIWDFISPILSDNLKERAKLQSPEELGKKYAFELFQRLEKVEFLSNEFVFSLKAFVDIMSNNPNLESQQIAKEKLTICINNLAVEIENLSYGLEDLYPQLSIHLPDFVEQIKYYIYDRSNNILEINEKIIAEKIRRLNLDSFAQKKIEDLKIIYEKAIENNIKISNCINILRSFLAKQYLFKESFYR
ncbi:hypothetical protein [Fibrella forsythiae]|uniref:DUF403 domain-containing protein n=1 Tax=Fibrella forsythiae TaxID=2817061 RepID=A0ABS3JDC4_9BACT|nr:hypothetical protein [Fibrella forsythiae]MBO0947264.1 hypothetical protein [Fibrella forsythiae]